MDKETAILLKGKSIADAIPPLNRNQEMMMGSTDVGDVSWVVPTIQCMTACWAIGTPLTHGRIVSQGAMPIARQGHDASRKGYRLYCYRGHGKPGDYRESEIRIERTIKR